MKKYAHEIKWGLIFTAVALVWMVLEKALGWHDEKIAQHATLTNIFAILAIAVFVFALLEKRKKLGGVMSWKEGFISGLLISVVVAILSPLAQWVTHALITPDYFNNAIAFAVESGKSTQEQAESFFNLSSYMVQASIGGLVMGLITSAIVALFVRKKATETAA